MTTRDPFFVPFSVIGEELPAELRPSNVSRVRCDYSRTTQGVRD